MSEEEELRLAMENYLKRKISLPCHLPHEEGLMEKKLAELEQKIEHLTKRVAELEQLLGSEIESLKNAIYPDRWD